MTPFTYGLMGRQTPLTGRERSQNFVYHITLTNLIGNSTRTTRLPSGFVLHDIVCVGTKRCVAVCIDSDTGICYQPYPNLYYIASIFYNFYDIMSYDFHYELHRPDGPARMEIMYDKDDREEYVEWVMFRKMGHPLLNIIKDGKYCEYNYRPPNDMGIYISCGKRIAWWYTIAHPKFRYKDATVKYRPDGPSEIHAHK